MAGPTDACHENLPVVQTDHLVLESSGPQASPDISPTGTAYTLSMNDGSEATPTVSNTTSDLTQTTTFLPATDPSLATTQAKCSDSDISSPTRATKQLPVWRLWLTELLLSVFSLASFIGRRLPIRFLPEQCVNSISFKLRICLLTPLSQSSSLSWPRTMARGCRLSP